MSGLLVVVATPIGNMGDLAPRATELLADADVVACEDTRRTGRLLEAAGVSARRLLPLHAHNEATATAKVVELLDSGRTVALVTDAGTPLVSDPGARTVAAAIGAGHRVTTVPGPSAALAALTVSGLETSMFTVEGFVPRKGAERTARLAEVAARTHTSVLFEAPHRVARTLADLCTVTGAGREVAVCRELTKLHEEVLRTTVGEAARLAADATGKGEHVIVVAGAPRGRDTEASDDEIRRMVQSLVEEGSTQRDAIASAAIVLSLGRNRVYRVVTEPRS